MLFLLIYVLLPGVVLGIIFTVRGVKRKKKQANLPPAVNPMPVYPPVMPAPVEPSMGRTKGDIPIPTAAPAPEPKVPVDVPTQSLYHFGGTAEGWVCGTCGSENASTDDHCAICGSAR